MDSKITYSVSVALAAYNGMQYIQKQISTVLAQLQESDELIVSVNPSHDGTEEYLRALAEKDHRVKVFYCEEKGVIANFENAILHCSNEIVYLCDQDDVWKKAKVAKVNACFTEDVVLVEHDCLYTDENLQETGQTLFKKRHPHTGFFYNYVHNSYQGSCMAFRKELIKYIVPIPRNIAMHDQWIGLIAEKMGRVVYLKEPLMLYRRHMETSSADDHIPIIQKISYMRRLIKPYFSRLSKMHELCK